EPADTRECGDDLLDHTVGEVLLLRVAAHVLERQHRDGRLVGQRQRWRGGHGGRLSLLTWRICQRWPVDCFPFHAKGPNGSLNVLERKLPQRMKLGLDAAFDRFANGARYDDSTWLRFGLQARRNIHAVAVKIVALDDQVAEMQPDTKDTFGFAACPVGVGHGLLELDRCRQCIDRAGKLDQGAIARELDKAAAVPRECWLQAFLAMLAKAREGSSFIAPHQARVA